MDLASINLAASIAYEKSVRKVAPRYSACEGGLWEAYRDVIPGFRSPTRGYYLPPLRGSLPLTLRFRDFETRHNRFRVMCEADAVHAVG